MKLPADFEKRTAELLGESDFRQLKDALQEEAPVSIRVNGAKWRNYPPDDKLLREDERVPWCKEGKYLNFRPAFTFDPLFHAGCYYVQEASSMFLAHVLKTFVKEPVRMLDLCAAPGGKSTLARSVLSEGSLLVANEVMRSRSQVLAENLVKWGHPDMLVSNNDPNDFSALPAFFDVILTDVPCSGEGMFRKDETAIVDWSVDNVNICRQRQRRILSDVWPALKDGGLLIYSTCTFNREENEENIAWIVDELGAGVLDVPTENGWNITGNLAWEDFPVYRFLPYKTKGEGLFMAVLRKKGSDGRSVLKRKQKNNKNKKGNVPVVPMTVKAWLNDSDMFNFTSDGSVISAVRKQFSDDVVQLQQALYVLQTGITLGTIKGKDIIPSQSLAMSTELNINAFPVAEVDYDQAVAYLRSETVALSDDVSRGYVLLTYKDIPLGFVKNIGNRANNLYPNEWRIRSTYIRKAEVI